MFEIGKEYRVFIERGGNLTSHEGKLTKVDGDLIMLEVEGVSTIFHTGSSSVAFVEVVDQQAEDSRARARADRMIVALS